MEQLSIFDMLYNEFSIEKPIRLIELFAGYGSQAMALENLGAEFETYKVVEFDKYAIASYNAVHGTNFETQDIKCIKGIDLDIKDMERFTYLLTYSFPCTDLSVAGQMKGMEEGSGTRSALLWEVKRILSELKEIGTLPQVLLMENVSAIHSEQNLTHFRKWLDFLDSLGYSNYVQDLNAYDYGVAQDRERTFCVSIHGKYNYKFPNKIDLKYCMEDYFEELDDSMIKQYILKHDKALNLLHELDISGKLSKKSDPSNKLIMLGQMDSEKDNTFEIINRVYSSKGIVNSITTCGGGQREPKTVKKIDKYENDYMYTDSKGNIYGVFKLTARECGRLMGVKDFAIDKMMNVNSKTQVYKQFGNSIVVPVLMALFSQLNLKGVKPWNKLTEEEKQILVKSTMDWKKED